MLTAWMKVENRERKWAHSHGFIIHLTDFSLSKHRRWQYKGHIYYSELNKANKKCMFDLVLLQPLIWRHSNLEMCHGEGAEKILLRLLRVRVPSWLLCKNDSGAYSDTRPTCKITNTFMGCCACLKGALLNTYSLCRAAQRIWWILWEAPAPQAAPGRQRRRVTPPRCCTSPPLCSGPHGTAEHPPCASDSTIRQRRDNINITHTNGWNTGVGAWCF